jgi:Hypothetical protein (DUF2513)
MPLAVRLVRIDSTVAFNNLNMKRDFELVRALLLYIEQSPPGKSINGLTRENYETEVISEHMALLIEEGFLKGEVSPSYSGIHYVVFGLTWKGHDFIDNARNDTVWKKVMADAENKGMSLSMSVLNGLLTKAAQKYMGLA